MKKLFTAFVAVILIGIVLNSCKKDESLSNSLSIEGTFTIGDKTYTNPTFNLGDPEQNRGYLTTFVKNIVPNAIRIETIDDIDLGNNTLFSYYLDLYTVEPGTSEMYAYISIYPNTVKTTGLYLYSNDATATVTKVDAVGGYIEGTFEGPFYLDKKVEVPYYLKGKFKVKRTEVPLEK